MKKYLEYTLLFCLTALMGSCIADDGPEGKSGNVTGEETDVNVIMQMPSSGPNTYAISTIDENQVETIDVLAFKPNASNPSGWEFTYKAKGTSITDQPSDNPTKSKKQFTTKLIKSTDEQTLVILGNVSSQVEALGPIGPGTDKDALLARLVSETTGCWNANNDNSKAESDPDRFRAFPMWGEVATYINDATTQITGVNLLRSLVRMDVALDAAVTNFSLNEIYIYNSKNKGRIVPDPLNLDGLAKVKAATVPPGSINNDTPLKYDVPTDMKRLFERTVYVYEGQGTTSNKSSEATCMVIGGTYGTDSKVTYYRVDFFKKDASDNYTADFRDILRNHRYRAYITSVSGSGYDTPDDAFNSKAVNMNAEVKEWDEGGMNEIIIGGQYILAVNQSLFEVPREAQTYNNKLTVTTDYPTGWTAEVTSGNSWLSIAPNASGSANATTALPFTVTANPGAPRTGTITIKAGRLLFLVTVTQTDKPGLSLDITPNALEFSNYNIQEQQTTITWNPEKKACVMTVAPIYNNGLLFSTPLPPVTAIGGSYQLAVKPDQIGADELQNNPFMEKRSTLLVSITDDEGVTITKKAAFKQVNFAVVPLPDKCYPLDGGTYSFKVKSNTNWTVSKISDTKNVFTLLTTSGTADTTTGKNVSFSLVNDLASGAINSASVTLRFSSPEGLFADTDVVINAASFYIILKKDVPVGGEDGGLDNDLMMQYKNLPVKKNWFVYNNRKQATFSHIDPPAAPQDYPIAAGSCAELTTGGFTDWRMPTMREMLSIFKYIREVKGGTSALPQFGFSNSTSTSDQYHYFTSTQDGEASGTYAMTVHPCNSTNRWGITTYTYFKEKDHTSHLARCVRTFK